MGALVALLILIGLAVLWAFFNFPPAWANERAVSVFNWSVIGACVMVIGSWVMYMGMLLPQEVLEKFGWMLTVAGALSIEIVFLFVMFILRNFWIFRAKRPGGW